MLNASQNRRASGYNSGQTDSSGREVSFNWPWLSRQTIGVGFTNKKGCFRFPSVHTWVLEVTNKGKELNRVWVRVAVPIKLLKNKEVLVVRATEIYNSTSGCITSKNRSYRRQITSLSRVQRFWIHTRIRWCPAAISTMLWRRVPRCQWNILITEPDIKQAHWKIDEMAWYRMTSTSYCSVYVDEVTVLSLLRSKGWTFHVY